MSEWPAKMEITAKDFDSLAGDTLYERLSPWLWPTLENDLPEAAPIAMSRLASAYTLWGEVANGGVAQYFANGEVGYLYTAEALGTINRTDAFQYLQKARSLLPSNFFSHDDATVRWDIASENEALTALDEAFWACLRDDTILDDLAVYARSHRKEFEPYFSK
jgi:Domain of unknown function (DUF4375)